MREWCQSCANVQTLTARLGFLHVPIAHRNSLGAVKAVTGAFPLTDTMFSYSRCRELTSDCHSTRTAAQLALAGEGIHSVSLDDAIEAMRLTARDMHAHYKETSMSGLATSVKIPLSSPAC